MLDCGIHPGLSGADALPFMDGVGDTDISKVRDWLAGHARLAGHAFSLRGRHAGQLLRLPLTPQSIQLPVHRSRAVEQCLVLLSLNLVMT